MVAYTKFSYLKKLQKIPHFNNTCLPNHYLILKIPFLQKQILNIAKDSSFSFTKKLLVKMKIENFSLSKNLNLCQSCQGTTYYGRVFQLGQGKQHECTGVGLYNNFVKRIP
jgi:hypothetical protein